MSNGFAVGSTHTRFRITSIDRGFGEAAAHVGARNVRKIAHNTTLRKMSDGTFAVQFHATDILRIGEGYVALDSGGYRSFTTKNRLNAILPSGVSVYSVEGIWRVRVGAGEPVIFADGMTLTSSRGGRVKAHNAGSASTATKLRKQIHAYSRAFAENLGAGTIPAPSDGDCWHCAFFGDAGGTGHLASHMSTEECYYVPSLLVAAAKERDNRWLLNYGLPALWALTTPGERDEWLRRNRGFLTKNARRVLRQYLGKRFGLALR